MVRRRTAEAERQILHGSRRSSVPKRFQDRIQASSLAAMMAPAGRKAYEYCLRWIENPAIPGPLLMGRSGTYKTHLLWATASEMDRRFETQVRARASALLERGLADVECGALDHAHAYRPCRADFPSMDLVVADGAQIAHEVRASVELRNLDEVVSRYRQFALPQKSSALFIDDVEVMKLSDWLHEELYRIFDYRYQERMPTFVATNLSMEELRRHLGDRIARRIADMTEPFLLGK